MIVNERQYEVTQSKLGELTDLKASVDDSSAGDTGFEDLQADALAVMIDDLRAELDEYE